MLIFLLKATLIWAAFLLLYFVFLSREKPAKKNRIYLWLSLLLGLIIPLLQTPFSFSEISQVTASSNLEKVLTTTVTSSVSANAVSNGFEWNVEEGVFFVWLTGVAVQFFLLIKSVIQLYCLKKRSEHAESAGLTYFINQQVSSPFSFGKYIFLPNEPYSASELLLILEHERNHNRQLHWLDNCLLSLLQILFWFHPLFYLFRNQIKLVHEYQVDEKVLPENYLEYGQLLIRQNQLSFKKTLVNTFNYSPLKNRIAMITKNQKSNGWKYALCLPVLALSFVLMSAGPKNNLRVTRGNVTTFNGNKIEWTVSYDTMFMKSPVNATTTRTVFESKVVKTCNGHPVINYTGFKPNKDLAVITANVQQALNSLKGQLPKDISILQVENLVIDQYGKVYYYDVHPFLNNGKTVKPNSMPQVNALVAKLLNNPKVVNPQGLKLDKPFYAITAMIQL